MDGNSAYSLCLTSHSPLPVVRCPLSVVRCLLSVFRCLSSVVRCLLSVVLSGRGGGRLFLLFFDLAFFYKFSGIAKFCKAGCEFFNGGFLRVVCDGDGACVDVCLK